MILLNLLSLVDEIKFNDFNDMLGYRFDAVSWRLCQFHTNT